MALLHPIQRSDHARQCFTSKAKLGRVAFSIEQSSDSLLASAELKFPLLGERRFTAQSQQRPASRSPNGVEFERVAFGDSRGGEGLSFTAADLPGWYLTSPALAILSPLSLPFALLEAWDGRVENAYLGLFGMKRSIQYALVVPAGSSGHSSGDEIEMKVLLGRVEEADLQPSGWVARFIQSPEPFRDVVLELDRKRSQAMAQIPPTRLWIDRRTGHTTGVGLQLPMIGAIRLERDV